MFRIHMLNHTHCVHTATWPCQSSRRRLPRYACLLRELPQLCLVGGVTCLRLLEVVLEVLQLLEKRLAGSNGQVGQRGDDPTQPACCSVAWPAAGGRRSRGNNGHGWWYAHAPGQRPTGPCASRRPQPRAASPWPSPSPGAAPSRGSLLTAEPSTTSPPGGEAHQRVCQLLLPRGEPGWRVGACRSSMGQRGGKGDAKVRTSASSSATRPAAAPPTDSSSPPPSRPRSSSW
jgi:hypothetical protein